MKLIKKPLFSSLILTVTLLQVAAEPLLKVNVKNLAELSSTVGRFAKAIRPNLDVDMQKEFTKGLGIIDASVIDANKPWEIVIWYEGSSQPLLAIKAPIGDLKQFKEKIGSDGFLNRSEFSWSQIDSGTSMAISKGAPGLTGNLTESEKNALESWKKESIKTPQRTVELMLQPSDTLRQQLIGIMSFAKMSVLQGLSSQNAALPNGINPAGLQEMMGIYFELIETWIAGIQEFKLGLELSTEMLTVEKAMTAKPGTMLASWFQKPKGKITDQDLKILNPKASLSFAGYLGKDSNLRKYIEKLTVVGFTMQNIKPNDAAVKEIATIMDKMLPMTFSGSMDMGKTFSFSGSYRFPASTAGETYQALKKFLKEGLQSMVGQDKLYTSATLTENQAKLNGISVDRFALALNLNNSLFSMPGQKEQIQLMYPNGKMEMDQALVGDRLLIATAGKIQELMDLVSKSDKPKTSFKLTDSTFLVGNLNILGFFKQAMSANPLIPDEVKTKFSQLDAQNTGIEFQVDLNDKLQSVGRVPIKLFQEFGKLRD